MYNQVIPFIHNLEIIKWLVGTLSVRNADLQFFDNNTFLAESSWFCVTVPCIWDAECIFEQCVSIAFVDSALLAPKYNRNNYVSLHL